MDGWVDWVWGTSGFVGCGEQYSIAGVTTFGVWSSFGL